MHINIYSETYRITFLPKKDEMKRFLEDPSITFTKGQGEKLASFQRVCGFADIE